MGKANDMVRMKKGWSRAGAIIAGAVLAISGGVAVAPVAGAAGATLYVATTGADDSECGAQADPCGTIQQAIENADSGDTVEVAAGTYETTGMNWSVGGKAITLRGPQAGVNPVGSSARSVENTANEAVIRVLGDKNVFDVNIDGPGESVVIDGFTFEDTTVYRGCGAPHEGSIEVRNNIFHRPSHNPSGGNPRILWAACGDFIVENNILKGDLTDPLSSSAYFNTSNGTVEWTGNDVRDFTYEGIIVLARDVKVMNNTFTNISHSAVHLAQVKGANNVISGNVITDVNKGDALDGDGSVKFGAVRLESICETTGSTASCTDADPTVITVTGNEISGAKYGLVTNVESPIASKGFTVKFNENDLSDIGVFGVANQGPAGVSAERNWWGTGTDVTDMIDGDDVVIEPYYIGPEMQELSDGTGAPSPSPNPSSVENLFGSLTASSGAVATEAAGAASSS